MTEQQSTNHSPEASRIAIAYPMGKQRDGFISRKAYESDLLHSLSQYVDILKLPYQYIEEGCDFDPDPDYTLVNIDTWGLNLFTLREQGKLNTPFFIYFHVIYGQDIYISYLLPLLRKEDVVVVASEYSRQCLLNISPEFPCDIHVIPLSVDVEGIKATADQSAAGKPAGEKVIAYLGQIIPGKGLGQLLECMPAIAENVKNLRLDIIGPLSGSNIKGEQSPYVTELQKRAAELGVSSYINWKGALFGKDKYQALSQADIFINPSVFKIETFGVVNIEALACGLPIVCTRWSAFGEIVTDGRDGFLIDVAENRQAEYVLDRDRLIGRVTQLLNDGALLAKMKKTARQKAYDYDYKKLTPQLIRLFRKKTEPVNGRWEEIKEKTFLDFRHLFSSRWLSIIHADSLDFKSYEQILQHPGTGVNLDAQTRHNVFKYLSASGGQEPS
jgi:glycosyltransferase involved in cell wall biosynthesis